MQQAEDLVSYGLRDGLSSNQGLEFFNFYLAGANNYQTPTHPQMHAWSFLVGLGDVIGTKLPWHYGIFFEMGRGRYETKNAFLQQDFKGEGEVLYQGFGLANVVQITPEFGIWFGLRGGVLHNSLDRIVRDGMGNFYSYSSQTNYYNSYFGIQRSWNLNDATKLQALLYHSYTHHQGDKFQIQNEHFQFSSIQSHKMRMGLEIAKEYGKFDMIYGVGYEREFDGHSTLYASGFALKENLQARGILAWMNWVYSPYNHFLIKSNLRAYGGERVGIACGLDLHYFFD